MMWKWFIYLTVISFMCGSATLANGAYRGAITSGETWSYELLGPSYLDTFDFQGKKNELVLLTVAQTTDYFHPIISLYQNTTLLAKAPYSAYQNKLSHILPGDGKYSVVVEDDNHANGAKYNISFLELPSGPFISQSPAVVDLDGGLITSGETRNGKINAGDMDPYQFTGTAGDKVIFTVGQTSDYFHPMLYLYTADGAKEAATSYSAYQNRLEHTLAKSGTYTLVLEDDNHLNSASYNLSFVELPKGPLNSTADPNGGLITSGETRSGKMDVGDLDAYQFTGKAGEKVIFTVGQTSDYFHPMLYLYAADGTKEAATSYSAYQNRLEHTLAKSGKYTLVLEDDNHLNSATYNLAFVEMPTGPYDSTADPDGGFIASGETRSGKMDVGDLDAYYFTGVAGDKVIIKVGQTTDYFHPMLYLYAADGTKEAATSYSAYQNRLEQTLAKSGKYSIILEDDDHRNSAKYSLSMLSLPRGPLTSTPDPDGGAMVSGESRSGKMGAADLDAYQFYGKAGDRMIISVAQTTDYFHPMLYLYTESGALETKTSYAAYSNKLDTVLEATGLYTVVAEDDNGLNTANYNISLASIPHTVYYTVCNFKYYYNNGKGDSYVGVVYGGSKSGYYKGYRMLTPTVDHLDENNQPGYYVILSYSLTTDASKVGRVLVNSYYDAETKTTHVPLKKGTTVGSNFLGSETDYIGLANNADARFGMYDGIFWEADVVAGPEENKYSFKYTYGKTLEYYTGIVYAGAEKDYSVGKTWTWAKADENGNFGVYEITKADYDAGISAEMYGQVFVQAYYDAESKTPYDPVNKGKAVGTDYLGSELDYIVKANVTVFKFGQARWEADVGDTFDFRYTYGNGDYYEGQVYAAPTYGYYTGRKITKKNETGKTGYFQITKMSYDDVDSGQYGKVTVSTYYDGDMSKKSYIPLNNTGALGSKFLGSEKGYIVKDKITDYSFGQGYYEADVGDRFVFIYTYGNEDYYTGYVYADPTYGYYNGWEKTKENELHETGWYEIVGKTYTGASSQYGKVYVNRYFNGDQDEKLYTPVSATTAKGSSYLGSEAGYILKANVAAFKFGQGYWEADVGDRYSFIYTYGNGDFYTGVVYADPAYGYYPSWKKTNLNETGEQGWYRITGMSYQGVGSSLYGKIIVKNYFDGSATGDYFAPLSATAYFGTAYLGSEYGYINELSNPVYKFGGGFEETDGVL